MYSKILPTLDAGNSIGIFSPSYQITYDAPYASKKAEQFLTDKGYKIIKGSCYNKSDCEYRSGTIKERADELNNLIHNDDIKCIMAAAGGYVSDSILPYIDYDYLKIHPKIIVGHSDVTSVLLAVYEECSFPVFYGPNLVTSFSHNSYYAEFAFNSFIKAINTNGSYLMETPEYYSDETTDWDKSEKDFEKIVENEKKVINKLKTINGGKARGRLIGGNTDNLSLLYGKKYCPEIKQGDILFLENINETADFFERIMSALYIEDILNKISGLIIGKPKNYDDIGSKKTEIDILKEILRDFNFPILADFDCGHTLPINTMPIGKTIELDAASQTVKVL